MCILSVLFHPSGSSLCSSLLLKWACLHPCAPPALSQAATLGDPRRPAEIKKYVRSAEEGPHPLGLISLTLGVGSMAVKVGMPPLLCLASRWKMSGNWLTHELGRNSA